MLSKISLSTISWDLALNSTVREWVEQQKSKGSVKPSERMGGARKSRGSVKPSERMSGAREMKGEC